jgi:molybdopterin converting factor subunit 1
MTVTVRLFAKLREIAGADAVAVDLPPRATVADLRQRLAVLLPDAASLLERSAVAVDHDFAAETAGLGAASEIAVIPPVSGG